MSLAEEIDKILRSKADAKRIVGAWLDLLGYSSFWGVDVRQAAFNRIDSIDSRTLYAGLVKTKEILECAQ